MMQDPKALIDDYLDGTIDDVAFHALRTWLMDAVANQRIFIKRVAIHNTIAEWAVERSGKSLPLELGGIIEAEDAGEASAWFDSFVAIGKDASESAKLGDQQLSRDNLKLAPMKSDSISMRQLADLGGYLLRNALTSKPAYIAYAAATVILACVLTFMFTTGSDQGELTVADSVGPVTVQQRIVATITNDTKAKWDRRPGDDLYAGQRFTLLEGFAEITTGRGAIAVLEAPATIELINNNNALRLHTGKLVGICETESSKGFMVQTPTIDIIDMGTRFGVEATTAEQAQVHVLSGSVSLSRTDAYGPEAKPISLEAGQALVANKSAGLKTIEFDPNRFQLDRSVEPYHPRFSGKPVIWNAKLPKDLGLGVQQSQSLQVYLEASTLTIDRDIAVDFNQALPWGADAGIGQQVVHRGEAVDIYLLHLDLLKDQDTPYEYAIDFDRPILGVVGSHASLIATDRFLGNTGTTYPDLPDHLGFVEGGFRGMEFSAKGGGTGVDQAWISNSGTTLNLRLACAASESMDQIRVILQAQGELP